MEYGIWIWAGDGLYLDDEWEGRYGWERRKRRWSIYSREARPRQFNKRPYTDSRVLPAELQMPKSPRFHLASQNGSLVHLPPPSTMMAIACSKIETETQREKKRPVAGCVSRHTHPACHRLQTTLCVRLPTFIRPVSCSPFPLQAITIYSPVHAISSFRILTKYKFPLSRPRFLCIPDLPFFPLPHPRFLNFTIQFCIHLHLSILKLPVSESASLTSSPLLILRISLTMGNMPLLFLPFNHPPNIHLAR